MSKCYHIYRPRRPRSIRTLRQLAEWILDQSAPDGECRLWRGFRNRRGYGQVRFQRTSYLTHRAVLEGLTGPPPAGMQASHTCHRGADGCVEPSHLLWETNADNARRNTGRKRGPYRKRPPRICWVDGCERLHSAQGLCSMHYQRWRKHR